MTVFRGVRAIHASELVDVRVRFHMGVKHRFVDTCVGAFHALEGLCAIVVTVMVFLN